MKTKTNKIIYWFLTIFVAFIFVSTGILKISISGSQQEMPIPLSNPSVIPLLGVVELVIAILWLIKRTGVFGALLGISYMGGVIATNLITGQSVIIPIIIQTVIWISTFYRFPELKASLFKR